MFLGACFYAAKSIEGNESLDEILQIGEINELVSLVMRNTGTDTDKVLYFLRGLKAKIPTFEYTLSTKEIQDGRSIVDGIAWSLKWQRIAGARYGQVYMIIDVGNCCILLLSIQFCC